MTLDEITQAISGVTAPQMASLDPSQQSAIGANTTGGEISAAGQLAGGLSHVEFGMQAQGAAEFQAQQLRQNAGQAQASAQHAAYSVQLQSQYMASRALAVAAGSGGGASDPTVVNLISRNAAEMAYRQQSVLYAGDEKARSDLMSANAKEYEGGGVMRNSLSVAGGAVLGADTTLLRTGAQGASMFQRFAGGGYKPSSPAIPAATDIWASNGPGE